MFDCVTEILIPPVSIAHLLEQDEFDEYDAWAQDVHVALL